MMSSEIISIATQSTTSVDNEQQPSLVQPPPPSKELPMSSFGQRRLYSRIDISGDRWLLPTEKLNEPPSIIDGIDRELDREIRYLGCELIQSGAILLRLPQVAAATGQILFQRYYYQKSFVRFNFEHTAMACLLLASKIEEAPRRPRDIINVFHRLQQMNRSQTLRENKFTPMVLDQHYVDKKNLIIKAERRVLNALGFVVHIKHPHKLIISYLNALKCTTNRHTELIQRAWSHMNDGLRTDMFLRYQPETIACACIFLAARMVTPPVPLPEDPETFNWFELFDASDRDVHSIALILLQLYQRKRVPNWSRIEKKLDALRQNLYRDDGDSSMRDRALAVATKHSKTSVVSTTITSLPTIYSTDKISIDDRNVTGKGSNVTGARDRNVNGRSSENDDFKQRKRTRSISSERRKSVPKRYRSPIRKKDRHRERDDDRRSSKLPREVEHRPRHKSKDRRRY